MDIKPLLLAAGLTLAASAYASADVRTSDMNANLDSLVTWTMEAPDKMEFLPSDINGEHQPYTVFCRSVKLSDGYTYNVTFIDKGSYADSVYTEPDGRRSAADLLVFEKSKIIKTSPHTTYKQWTRYSDDGADGMKYGSADVIGGNITVRMDEKGLAQEEFGEYVRHHEDDVSAFLRLIR